ncbi:hypothetical protein KDW39_23715 [Burkholderia multivorans]|uniref:hypothetical protein n=1 Tax=Burkholderia multivorans TaxID=87883 RepID=UPI001B99E5C2|nr:hypothetical protein [Burkholderia multivorans]MBR8126160.1 hypothetical protein [Burkholderia multivorans]MBU9601182.1 hypothetical protein [Burkholderia multivorans]
MNLDQSRIESCPGMPPDLSRHRAMRGIGAGVPARPSAGRRDAGRRIKETR